MEYLSTDEVLELLNISSKVYLSRYLKKHNIKLKKGSKKPYLKQDILLLAQQRQNEAHHNSKQSKDIKIYIEAKPTPPPLPPPKQEKPSLDKQELISEQKKVNALIKELESLGLFESVDEDLIRLYVKNVALAQSSIQRLNLEGLTLINTDLEKSLNPELIALNNLIKNIQFLSKALGIGIFHRKDLKISKNKSISAFDELLGD